MAGTSRDQAGPAAPGPARITTGISGLDHVLGGGLTPNRLYLVEGTPGSGKTTLALQFLQAARMAGEPCLYITLSETQEELSAVVASHGMTLDGINVFELASAEVAFNADREMTLLHPWEVELGETVKRIIDEIERVKPTRVVFDSLSEMRLLAQDPLRYRRQILSLKQFFVGRKTTVLLLDDLTGGSGQQDLQLHSISHGVITLERLTLEFGAARRRLQVQKMRGAPFSAGYHDMAIRHGGLEVFPRLVAAEHHKPFSGEPLPSGLPELDALLGGGPLRGTCTLVNGPAGTGKTTLALQYVAAACARGERSVIFEFDERIGTLLSRAARQGMDLQLYIDQGLLLVRQIDPAEIAPGEFSGMIRHEVEVMGARLIVIDSLSGYEAAMPQEKHLVLQMHEILSYLNQQGVATLLINSQPGMIGTMTGALHVSYIADAVLLVRFFEAGGRVRKALSVLKNRGGSHEDSIRELRIDENGLRIGAPLTGFHGVLTGTPSYAGQTEPLLEERPQSA
ncbi:ATPase domain-containing protein [Roseomonas marmotae]|uniref:non-specific serine/threonine protein kinase n=1 Tax=Roseomonas marmotae TaxID=2768161 RepID=A0ABS3KF21_9PROT|nr:ATPase domain-containing protein [Roseomonas marmotae]MBO1076035.1 AAA family ATPase [Roseomonas marmotae]QTI80165.1 AAA family ATPase [Roseomonas marmotae]